MNHKKLSFLTVVILAFCILAITATLFPNHNAVYYNHLNTWSGILDPIPGESIIEQPLSLPEPSKLLMFTMTSLDQEISRGQMDINLRDAKSGEIVYSHRLTVKETSNDQSFTLPVDVEAGDYVLELMLSDFDPLVPASLYAAETSDYVGSACIDGVNSGRSIYLDSTTHSQVFAIPLLAVLILLLALPVPLFYRNRKQFLLRIAFTAICMLSDAIGLILPVSRQVLHFPLIILQLLFLLVLLRKEQAHWGCSGSACHLWLQKYRTVIAAGIGTLVISLILGAGIEVGRSAILTDAFLIPKWFFFSSVLFCVFIHLVFRKKLIQNLPVSFLIVILSAGLCMTLFLPAATPVGWDDGIHYERTVYLSEGPVTHISRADKSMTHFEIERTFSVSAAQKNREFLNAQHDGFTRRTSRSAWGPDRIGYLPHVFGLWVGRILGLDYVNTFLAGRIFNLLFYSLVIYFAMKRLKSGQLLLYVIALFPTGLFQAANYSYDPWVNSLYILGFAYFLGALQRPEEPITAKEVAIMLTALVIGSFPKAVYAACMPILLLLPREKALTRKSYRNYLLAVTAATAAALLTYFVPFVLAGAFASSGDMRGGSDINSMEQVRFIFSNPMAYTKILLQFLSDYLSPAQSHGYTCFMAYLGGKDLHTLAMVLLFGTALLDRSTCDRSYQSLTVKAFSAFFLFGTVCLVATALYITFTPVGYYTINGCQPRYLLPLLFPAFALIGNVFTKQMVKPAIVRIVTIILSAGMLWYEIWFAIVSRYIP